jgi:RNA polymerase sigma factor (sigma-70 family)
MTTMHRTSPATLIETLYHDGSATGFLDEELIAKFVSDRGAVAEQAFEVLVKRHGPMVLGVCRGVLRDAHDAEDAFQATFLVLARRAASLVRSSLLGPWLHGVALRTARKTRDCRLRQRQLIERALEHRPPGIQQQPGHELSHRDETQMLHDEIGRLPEHYRAPLILCGLEGLTHEQASARLGVPPGTVGVRLMRARERLQARLSRRGVAPSLATLPALSSAAESLCAPLASETAWAATAFAARSAAIGTIAPEVISVARAVLASLAIKRAGIVIGALVVAGVLAAGSFAVAFQTPAKRSQAPGKAASSQDSASEKGASNSILANGGFEDGAAGANSPASWKKGPSIRGVSFLWDRDVAHQGKSSLHFRKTEQRYFPIAQWLQEVKRAGTAPRLKVSAFVRARKTTKAIVDVQFYDQADQFSHNWAAYIGAKQDGDPPVTHDWKKYEGVVDIPASTQKLVVALQIYGPGDVWFDDVAAEYTNDPATEAAAAEPAASGTPKPATADVADIPSHERIAGGDTRKRYFLIGAGAAADHNVPAAGYRIVVLLPGGAGGADFLPFAKRIAKYALPRGYLIAQLLAVEWTPKQFESVVWPTTTNRPEGVGFTTEEFIDAVIADVAQSKKIDSRFIFTLGWSSGGPPVYATGLQPRTRTTGSFIAMSIFGREGDPSLKNARGRRFYVLHSPQDFIPLTIAERARDELSRAGASVTLQTYEGGHGWRGDVHGEIRRGIGWLEQRAPKIE